MQVKQVDDEDDGVSDDCQVATYPIICTEVSITDRLPHETVPLV